jgi:WD40 repeat protein
MALKWNLAYICDIVSGKVLYVSGGRDLNLVRGTVYSQKLNSLAIVTHPAGSSSTVEILDLQTAAPPVSHKIQQELSCFTFSQTTNELVCGTATCGLQLLNTLTGRWRHFEYPHRITFLSSLPSGTIVAGVVGSGIQLLSLDKGYASFRQPSMSAPTVHALDQGRVISVLPPSKDCIVLLEPATMPEFLVIRHRDAEIKPDWTEVLCPCSLATSLENRIEVCCHKREGFGRLQFWRSDIQIANWAMRTSELPSIGGISPSGARLVTFHNVDSQTHRIAVCCHKREGFGRLQFWRSDIQIANWAMRTNELPTIGGISPSGARLVTFHNVDSQTHIYVWDTQNGRCQRRLRVDKSILFTNPLEIRFESEDRFYSHYDTHRVPYDLDFSQAGSRAIFRRPQQPLGEQSHMRPYDVDDNREWVVSGSRRVCWIPPGYIGSAEGQYCWAGSVLVMVGQNGTLRKLDFCSRSLFV